MSSPVTRSGVPNRPERGLTWPRHRRTLSEPWLDVKLNNGSVPDIPEDHMDAKQLAKLVRQTAAKAEKLAKARQGRRYDTTLPPPPEDDSDIERQHFFKEMKKREF